MAQEASLKRLLPAGVVDSGFASLAGFVVAVTAVSVFNDVDRGVYAIFFTAFVVGSLLANELIFTPAEVEAVAYPVSERLSLVSQSLRLGIGPALAGTLAAPVAVAVTAAYATTEVALGLAVTSATAIVVSPMQDHVRRMLHIAELSWRAAAVSIVQFVIVSAGIAVGIATDVPEAWLPFGALAIANVISLAVARLLAHVSIRDRAAGTLRFRELAKTGVWFVLNAAPAAVWFGTAAVIAALAGPEALGFAESARVVAQPILVFATGLTAVLAPRAMRAGMHANSGLARRTSVIYLASIGAAGAVYLAIAGWDWVLNPMEYLVPSAYSLGGLAAFSILANVATAASFLQGDELAGAGRVRILAGISWLSSIVGLLGGLTASYTGAYARPLAVSIGAAARYGAQARVLAGVYDAAPTKPAPDEGSTAQQ